MHVYVYTHTETETKGDVTTQIKKFREILIEIAIEICGEKQTQRSFRDTQKYGHAKRQKHTEKHRNTQRQ